VRTYDLHDAEGRVYAFEVSSLLGRRGAVRVIRSIPAARVTRTPVALSWLREETFCEFELDDVRFVVWEPFGDSSRYWIGPEPVRRVPQLDKIRFAQRSSGPDLSAFRPAVRPDDDQRRS
jgi:hypothetical protein